MLRRLLIVTVAVVAVATPSALAANPPNVVDQYTEQVPTAGGETPTTENPTDEPDPGTIGAPASTGGGTGAVPGEAPASVPGEAPTSGSESGPGRGATNDGDARGGTVSASDRSTVGDTEGSADSVDSGDNGMGLLFPALLIAALIAVVSVFLIRRGTVGSRTG